MSPLAFRRLTSNNCVVCLNVVIYNNNNNNNNKLYLYNAAYPGIKPVQMIIKLFLNGL